MRKLIAVLLGSLLSTSAFAGVLATGLQLVPYQEQAVVAITAERFDCLDNTEMGWRCLIFS